jgi:hypothetical protein
MEKMKSALLVAALAVLILASCTTIQNRRDLFSPQPVDGPYTRMLKDGSWRNQKAVDTVVGPDSSANGSTTSDSKVVMPPLAE